MSKNADIVIFNAVCRYFRIHFHFAYFCYLYNLFEIKIQNHLYDPIIQS